MNKVAYLYKVSIIYPYVNSVECPNNCIEIQNQDLCDILRCIEYFVVKGLQNMYYQLQKYLHINFTVYFIVIQVVHP